MQSALPSSWPPCCSARNWRSTAASASPSSSCSCCSSYRGASPTPSPPPSPCSSGPAPGENPPARDLVASQEL